MSIKEKIKKILPGDRKENKTIPVDHSYKHPDVKKLSKKFKKQSGTSLTESQALDKAKDFMNTLQTMKSKDMTKKEGSFAKGGRVGYKSGGCAQIRGFGKARKPKK